MLCNWSEGAGKSWYVLAKIENILVDEDLIETDGKINFTKAKLFAYSHGEYFPLNKYAVGKFGYSVAKKKKKKVK